MLEFTGRIKKDDVLKRVKDVLEQYDDDVEFIDVEFLVQTERKFCLKGFFEPKDKNNKGDGGGEKGSEKRPKEKKGKTGKRKYIRSGKYSKDSSGSGAKTNNVASMTKDYDPANEDDLKTMKAQVAVWHRTGLLTDNEIVAKSTWPRKVKDMNYGHKTQVKDIFDRVKKRISK